MKDDIVTDLNFLHTPSLPVANPRAEQGISVKLKKFLQKNKDAAGVAAIQLGHPIRVCAVRLDDDWVVSPLLVMINPRITTFQLEVELTEGCLSLPGQTFRVKRFSKVRTQYFDERGVPWTKTFIGIDAIKVQHELDHLDGVLISDRGTPVVYPNEEAKP